MAIKSKTEILKPVVELLIVIVDGNKGEKVVKLLNEMRVDLQILSVGKGTAPSAVGDYLGVGTKDKDVVMAIIKIKDSQQIQKVLDSSLKLSDKNTGIAMTIPIKSAMERVLENAGCTFIR